MNLNIYLENHLAEQLREQAEKLHKKKNSIVREAITEWLNKHSSKYWPKTIIEFEGIKEWDEVSKLRSDLSAYRKELF